MKIAKALLNKNLFMNFLHNPFQKLLFYGLVKSHFRTLYVIPAKAGIQSLQ